LCRLPSSPTPSSRDLWLTWPVTGLVCGLLVVAKFSALPLVLGSGVYFLFRDGWRLTAPKIGYAIWFGFFLPLPGAIVYLLNRLWTGEATAQVHGSQPLFPVGLPQVWNLIVSPLADLSGLSDIAFHLPARLWITAGLSLPALVIWFGLGYAWFKRPRSETPNHFVRLMILMTVTTWGFLLFLTLILGYQCDWTTQPRYSFPVAFAWLCGGMVLIFSQRVPKVLRICLALAYCFPVSATLMAGAAKPFLHASPVPLPQSHLAGTPGEREAYQFLEDRLASDAQRRPQLIVANQPHPMNELLIPAVPWMYFETQEKLTSSRPMVVWALLDPSSAEKLRQRLDEHGKVERVNTPAGFPWEFLIVSFP